MMQQSPWPSRLWIVRHGQSSGNVARDAAEAAGHSVIDIADRDIDVPLSELGRRQSIALGEWFARMDSGDVPEVVLCSPYVRARETAQLVAERARWSGERVVTRMDERLREKEFGILDRLTKLGIQERHPELNQQRQHVGKFYFRPPGGESWCDVILRLRSLLEMVSREYVDRRVLVVAHQVIVNCMRYLLEQMDEQQILDIDRQGDVPNCAVTMYEKPSEAGGPMRRQLTNFVAPLLEADAAVTTEPDKPRAARP